MIQQFAPSKASILVEGESGTGKELVARGIHQASERRGPFVPVNCGAIAPELLESELFGHASGAFTGAKKSREGLFRVANGGTLFLDEIGEMPLAMQSSLLRVLEQKAIRPVGTEKEIPVDVRVVAATNRDLEQEVKQGRFRADLFYRLNVLRIDVKPLRERKQDIQDLVPFFTRILAKELGIEEPKWAHQDIQALMGYNWPGNIRELRNLIERSILLRQSPASQLLGIEVAQPISVDAPELGEEGYPLEWSLKEVEKAHILSVVEKHQGNKSAAARDLGVARKTLERKFKEWGNESYPCV
ncbi:sigma-54 dependent response regulator [Vibrio ishigakensis]|uniref:Sigma-54 dependent response regulator n=1 Tax=Vibrio ishigakensis TaxID=1481914 RepID=A0A0B8PLB6_9VIBR|nr:sigma-54 dependent response regulator [Vibrio ishigakensis]